VILFSLSATACSSIEDATLTTTALSTTSRSVSTATSAPSTTTAQVETTTTITPPRILPKVPQVFEGWALEAGDLLVSNEDGVHIVRLGVVVATAVTSPVETAVADRRGGMVVLAPDPDVYPAYWPDPFTGGGRVLWRVSPDGTAEALYTSDGPAFGKGKLSLLGVDVVSPISEAPSAIFTKTEPHPADPVFDWERVLVLPLDGTTTPTLIPVETPGEGGVTGLGWQGSTDRLLMTTGSDGGAFLSMWSGAGDPVAWSTNPLPEGRDGYLKVTTIPGTTLIAYTEASWREPADLVVFDTGTGTELRRVRIDVPDTTTLVKMLHAGIDAIAISRVTIEQQEGSAKWVYLPVLVYDLTTGTLTEMPLVGTATLVS
jgi:hypothetical protein